MKSLVIPLILFLLTAVTLRAQETAGKPYDPAADAPAQLDAAIAKAAAAGKHVFVVVGGNWCSWCLKLDRLMKNDRAIDSLLTSDFVTLHVNNSKENKNAATLARLGHPDRFGFPVLVILDDKGQRLHTQDSGLLEKDGGHDPEAVYRFLYLWRPDALHSAAR